MTDALTFAYEREPHTQRLVNRLRDCAESISLGFTEYGNPHTKGPGLYVAVIAGRTVTGFADPMGNNRWPVEDCRNVLADEDCFHEALSTVSRTGDGGVVVGVDGTILAQMVRFRNITGDDLPPGRQLSELEFADWMGARHMSAYELSLRRETVVTVTLSEETGRVTVFRDGNYETVTRGRLGEPWRASE